MNGGGFHDWATAVSAISTVVTAMAACAAAWIYRSQAREMENQSRLLTKSIEGSNLLRLMVDVLDEDARHAARRRVMVLWSSGVHLSSWSEEDRRAGERVIRTFALMGLMVRRELLDKALVLATWHMRIVQMHAATKELLEEMRTMNGPSYMCDFDWLAAEAKAYRSDHEKDWMEETD